MTGYIFEYQGAQFDSNGRANVSDVNKHNKALDEALIAQLSSGISSAPEKLFLYVGNDGTADIVKTWTGAPLGYAWIGARSEGGLFNGGLYRHTYKRPIRARLHGVLYHGWFFQSSGDYCRLKKAKRQTGARAKYRATNLLKA